MLEAKQQLASARTERDQTFYESKCATLDRQIDNLVYELYDLRPEEIAIVESSGSSPTLREGVNVRPCLRAGYCPAVWPHPGKSDRIPAEMYNHASAIAGGTDSRTIIHGR